MQEGKDPFKVDPNKDEDEFAEELMEVHMVTAADLTASRFTFADVVLPLPGYDVTYSDIPSVKAVYDRWLKEDGVTLPR